MSWMYAWLLVLTCANVGLLGLVVYAIIRPNQLRREFQELFGGVQALSSIVSRLDWQLSVIFGDDVAEQSHTPVAKAPPAKRAA